MQLVIKTAFVVAITAAIGFTSLLRADEPKPIKLTLHPMAEPTPALKYRLLPPANEQISGNAAVAYGKVTAEQWVFFSKYANTDVIDSWQEMSLEKLRSEKIPIPGSSVFFLEQAAKCKYCDWQLPIGQMPFYEIMLPEGQQSRSYARMLAVKARMAIAKGNFDEALKTFQTNCALGHNVAQGETLVNGLIGIAINGIMVPQIHEYVQQPKAPNLYWALTTLPNPLIDMQRALDVESQALELSFPELRDLENAKHSPEGWRDIFHGFAEKVVKLIATSGPSSPPQKSRDELDKTCEKIFPAAKRDLIAAGLPTEKVEAMNVHQVALLHTLRVCHELFDSAAKYYSLPYPQAMKGIEASTERLNSAINTNEIIPIAGQTKLVFVAIRNAVARNERQIAMLRIIEALRIFAAAHDGQLPKQLSDITEVPIPDDPVSGKPFVFRREAEKAFLEGAELPKAPLMYEITMANSK